jgi:hypothetical protein
MSQLDDIKARIKAEVNLADLVRRDGVPLTGGPTEFKGLCPFHAEKTPSFTVFNKEGSWGFCCFGCGEKGDVFSWVMRRKSIGFMDALKWLAAGAGIALPEQEFPPTSVEKGFHSVGRESVRSEFDPKKYRALVPEGKVWRYLTGERRLDGGLLVDYSVGEMQDGEAYSFGYKWRPPGWSAEHKPKFEFVKVVKMDRPDGKKVEWREPKGGKNILFGMCAPIVERAHADSGELIICEGEIDAISWAQYGWPAVSVPGGATYLGWIQVCWEWLMPWKKIHLSFDEDPRGYQKLMEAVKRLGMARTDIVRLRERPS